jgi:pSer/pThr/pTyr-binding forkhead associated (FHA) protein
MVKVLLIVVQGKPEGKTIPITGEVFRVGRALDCHLRPNSEEVSRLHSEITLSETEAVVRDLGSRNGTWVNGQLLKGPHKLSSGELLKIGPLTFAVAIQGLPESQVPAAGPVSAAGVTRAPSLDDVPPDQIDAWLVSDQTRPTPDRPSGVYDGDTLTLEAYREVRSGKPGSSGAMPAKAEPTPPPLVSSLEDQLEGIEMLPEGRGDAVDDEEEATDEEGNAAEGDSAEEELVDETNPFYAAKKAAEEAKAGPEKAEYKDSSEAASDILRKMLDRRRAPR